MLPTIVASPATQPLDEDARWSVDELTQFCTHILAQAIFCPRWWYAPRNGNASSMGEDLALTLVELYQFPQTVLH